MTFPIDSPIECVVLARARVFPDHDRGKAKCKIRILHSSALSLHDHLCSAHRRFDRGHAAILFFAVFVNAAARAPIWSCLPVFSCHFFSTSPSRQMTPSPAIRYGGEYHHSCETRIIFGCCLFLQSLFSVTFRRRHGHPVCGIGLSSRLSIFLRSFPPTLLLCLLFEAFRCHRKTM